MAVVAHGAPIVSAPRADILSASGCAQAPVAADASCRSSQTVSVDVERCTMSNPLTPTVYMLHGGAQVVDDEADNSELVAATIRAAEAAAEAERSRAAAMEIELQMVKRRATTMEMQLATALRESAQSELQARAAQDPLSCEPKLTSQVESDRVSELDGAREADLDADPGAECKAEAEVEHASKRQQEREIELTLIGDSSEVVDQQMLDLRATSSIAPNADVLANRLQP